jgi:hypothetical protein
VTCSMDIVREHIRPGYTAHEFMHEAQLALREPELGNLALVEMRQIDPAA